MLRRSIVLRGLAVDEVVDEHILDIIDRYVKERVPTGGFLEAVLCNDLREAYNRADDQNFIALPWIVFYLYNEVPGDCWGSLRAVKNWLAGPDEDENEEER